MTVGALSSLSQHQLLAIIVLVLQNLTMWGSWLKGMQELLLTGRCNYLSIESLIFKRQGSVPQLRHLLTRHLTSCRLQTLFSISHWLNGQCHLKHYEN